MDSAMPAIHQAAPPEINPDEFIKVVEGHLLRLKCRLADI